MITVLPQLVGFEHPRGDRSSYDDQMIDRLAQFKHLSGVLTL
jgi:hypothetical protein